MNNNIELHYVNYDFAKFLKSKGFNVPCKQAFYGDVEDEDIEYNEPTTTGDDFILGEYDCYAPEHWEVVEWLRVNYGIFISCEQNYKGEFWTQVHKKNDHIIPRWEVIAANYDSPNSPQEAYSAAFDYIKNNNLI
jgi:hypothetical protein